MICKFLINVQNPCSSSPCENNGTCQAGFTSKGFRCVCHAGFTGANCHEGMIVTTAWFSLSSPKRYQLNAREVGGGGGGGGC